MSRISACLSDEPDAIRSGPRLALGRKRTQTDRLAGYRYTAGSLHLPVDRCLPRDLVEALLAVRTRQVREGG